MTESSNTASPASASPSALRADPIALALDHWVEHGWHAAADGMALVTSVMRVQQVFLARVEAVLRPRGLTFARFEVLRLLGFSRTGTLPIGKIGQRLQVHAASVTNAVQRLEIDGCVERRPNPHDGRSVLVTLTDTGRSLVERCTVELNAEVFGSLPLAIDRQRDVFDALRDVRERYGDWVQPVTELEIAREQR
ncbi:MAG TPA: MarR family transcriptional regulator [Ilumatobacter sp.]|nr:MarR family transcriptional regulator [Ilumatobacter sp.]